MKLTNRARAALAAAGYDPANNPAIAQLVAFAAQNPGLEYGNYGNPTSYNQEARSISKAWREFKDALVIAGSEGVSDAEVIAEAPHAYSGRLEWEVVGRNGARDACPSCFAKPGQVHAKTCTGGLHDLEARWSYCAGQYFPTEYRNAARVLLEYATRRVRQARPPQTQQVETIAELKALNARNGGCWFNPPSMRFFGTRIESSIIRGRYFVTSEQQGEYEPRKFTIRSFDEKGSVDTVGKFFAYDTKRDALAAIPRGEGAA